MAGIWPALMTVNGLWRICFELRKGDAHDVEAAEYPDVGVFSQTRELDHKQIRKDRPILM